jgi:hypothetical protein
MMLRVLLVAAGAWVVWRIVGESVARRKGPVALLPKPSDYDIQTSGNAAAKPPVRAAGR